MLLNAKDVGVQFERYLHTGEFDLPAELDLGQKAVFDHIAQAIPQSLFVSLENSIKFLFDREVELVRALAPANEQESRVLELREELIGSLAESGELKPLMGQGDAYVISNYLVYDLKGLAESLSRT